MTPTRTSAAGASASVSAEKSQWLDIATLLAPMQSLALSSEPRSLPWRLTQLSALKLLIAENRPAIISALESDLGKDPIQAMYTEISTVTREIDHVSSNLSNWMRPDRVATPGVMAVAFSEVRRAPRANGREGRSACLVVGSFNYPLSLCLLPVIGSLAGGNPTVIKPSDKCPAMAGLLGELVEKYFDRGAVRVIQGGVEETTALLEQPWGLICFTGSERVGKIFAAAAARTLTPCVLELGGKCPVYVARDCPDDFRTMANRIAWAKTLNCGQTCLAPDYVVCDRTHAARLCDELVRSLERMFGKDPRTSELSRIVDVDTSRRLVDLIREVEDGGGKGGRGTSGPKILCGGSAACNPDERYIAPTVILDPPHNSRFLKEEIFGPILPVLTVDTEEEAIGVIRSVPGTPLNLSVFTTSADRYDRIIAACPAAGAHRNDCIVANASSHLPFGGLGSSGYGRYHGKFSFDTFTHEYLSVFKPCHWLWEFGGLRYHPYNGSTLFVRLNDLPNIPVLHTRNVLFCAAVFFVLAYIPPIQPITGIFLNGLSDVLLLLSERLRPAVLEH